jgi:hypothetical protein
MARLTKIHRQQANVALYPYRRSAVIAYLLVKKPLLERAVPFWMVRERRDNKTKTYFQK